MTLIYKAKEVMAKLEIKDSVFKNIRGICRCQTIKMKKC